LIKDGKDEAGHGNKVSANRAWGKS
jgi:hypothetical protein